MWWCGVGVGMGWAVFGLVWFEFGLVWFGLVWFGLVWWSGLVEWWVWCG